MSTLTTSRHSWRFFRAGGFDQVHLSTGADIANLGQLDQKLWVALASPTRGLEFDSKTLDLIDTDKDGRIRAPEVIAAAKWACAMLKDPDDLTKSLPILPLSAINDANPDGLQLLASAKQILTNLGEAAATGITAEDTADTAKIFAKTKFNGDGIIPPDASEDPKLQAIINDIISCLGSETDRSGKPGIDQPKLDLFFANAEAFAKWQTDSTSTEGILPLGANTAAAAAALKAIAPKVEDYFARCRLAAFDARAVAAVNLTDAEYAAIAGKSLSLAGAEFTNLPLARIEPGRQLPLTEGINPGWRTAMENLYGQVVKPILGERKNLTEQEWAALVGKFATFDAWLGGKAGEKVEKLGLTRIQEILAWKSASGSGAKTAIGDLISKDKALEPEANAIAAVDRLVRYHRDLYKFLNNFVAFRDFYSRKDKAVFQAGVLYLDQRSCELCIRVEDAGRHGSMAHLAYTYLAYCDLTRKATGEKMAVACAFTAGDSDNLMVGRNGIFYDRKGQDWDATITKIIDNPISIRQAFWSPYKRLARWVEEQVAKRAAAADAASTTRLQAAATHAETSVTTGTTDPALAPPPESKKLDVGVVAALGVAVGALTTAAGILLTWASGVPIQYFPIYIVGVILLISTPSMILAALKLRQRNLGPILDANGWAVNAKAKMNIPFGGALTQIPKLPPGSHRDAVDPYAESHKTRNRVITALVILAVLWIAWYCGVSDLYFPGYLPTSPMTQRREKVAEDLITEANAALTKLDLPTAEKALETLDHNRWKLSSLLAAKIDSLHTTITNMKAQMSATKPAETIPAPKP